MKSASTPGQVDEQETNAKERGWSRRNETGRISCAARSKTSIAGLPSSGGASINCFSSSCWKSPSQAPSPGSLSMRSTRSSAALRARSSISGGAIRRLPSLVFGVPDPVVSFEFSITPPLPDCDIGIEYGVRRNDPTVAGGTSQYHGQTKDTHQTDHEHCSFPFRTHSCELIGIYPTAKNMEKRPEADLYFDPFSMTSVPKRSIVSSVSRTSSQVVL